MPLDEHAFHFQLKFYSVQVVLGDNILLRGRAYDLKRSLTNQQTVLGIVMRYHLKKHALKVLTKRH